MHILVFSDSHLNLPFEEKKFALLKRIISEADKIIICGDFWEGYQVNFETFIKSPWKGLFPILKSKNSVYLFGNHDKEKLSDNRITLFSVSQEYQYRLTLNGKTFVFEHGNRLCPFFDDILKMTKTPLIFSKITSFLLNLIIRSFGKNYTRLFYKRFNDVIKKRVEKEFKKGEILICGHTHFAEVDLKHRFINLGFIKHGLAQYLIIDNGKIIPKEELYE